MGVFVAPKSSKERNPQCCGPAVEEFSNRWWVLFVFRQRPFTVSFLGEESPTNIDHRTNGYSYCNLCTGGPSYKSIGTPTVGVLTSTESLGLLAHGGWPDGGQLGLLGNRQADDFFWGRWMGFCGPRVWRCPVFFFSFVRVCVCVLFWWGSSLCCFCVSFFCFLGGVQFLFVLRPSSFEREPLGSMLVHQRVCGRLFSFRFSQLKAMGLIG